MTIILKLQGLDVNAGTEDIRKFFKCLQIPDGGVYVVGGSLREAFIAFTTERDAQLAMRHSGKFLKKSKVTLHISSMEELEHVLESLLKKNTTKPSPNQLTGKRPLPFPIHSRQFMNECHDEHNPGIQPLSTALPLNANTANLQTTPVQSLDSNTAFLLGVCTVLQGLHSSFQSTETLPVLGFPSANNTVVTDELKTPEPTLKSGPGYVRLFGLPFSTTKEDICHFFKGLTVQEVIVNVKLGTSHGCLVKFARMQDACDALHFNHQSLGPICVEVHAATETMWTNALQQCENADIGKRVKPQKSFKEIINRRQKATTALQLKRKSVYKLTSKAPKKQRPDCDLDTPTPAVEYIVMVRNLSQHMTKTEIKELFRCSNLAHKNVLHLLDKESNRTDTAFLIFNSTEDYDYAMNLTGCHVGSNVIEVSSVTKNMMWDMMAKTHPRDIKKNKKLNQKRKSSQVETLDEPRVKPDLAAKTCLFVRNMPAHVQKSHLKDLFCKYKLKNNDIHLLYDSGGNCIGEAVVQFKSQTLADLALRLHGQKFMGTQILLTSINVKQMKDILARN